MRKLRSLAYAVLARIKLTSDVSGISAAQLYDRADPAASARKIGDKRMPANPGRFTPTGRDVGFAIGLL